MKQRHIHILLFRFFEKKCSKEIKDNFGSWLIQEEDKQEKEEVMLDIWNSLPVTPNLSSMHELNRVNQRIHKQNKFTLHRWVAAVAIILLPLIGGLATFMVKNTGEKAVNVNMTEHFVAYGNRKHLVLPDGSSVWLNAGSLLVYPEGFEGRTRMLFLSGEAHFTVAKDAEKPFIVKTNYIEIEALGTIFSVESYPDADKTVTILESGKVQVNDKERLLDAEILNPDEQLVYSHKNNSFTKNHVDAEHLSSWINGYVIFQEENLGNIFHTLEKRYNVKINYDNNKFASATYTVRFHPDETLKETLEILKQIEVSFTYKIKGKDVFID